TGWRRPACGCAAAAPAPRPPPPPLPPPPRRPPPRRPPPQPPHRRPPRRRRPDGGHTALSREPPGVLSPGVSSRLGRIVRSVNVRYPGLAYRRQSRAGCRTQRLRDHSATRQFLSMRDGTRPRLKAMETTGGPLRMEVDSVTMKRIAVLVGFLLAALMAAVAPPETQTSAQANCFQETGFC